MAATERIPVTSVPPIAADVINRRASKDIQHTREVRQLPSKSSEGITESREENTRGEQERGARIYESRERHRHTELEQVNTQRYACWGQERAARDNSTSE
jgi:hypothetical protein